MSNDPPKKKKKVQFNVDEDLHAQAHEWARKNNVSLAAVMRAWLRRFTNPSDPSVPPKEAYKGEKKRAPGGGRKKKKKK